MGALNLCYGSCFLRINLKSLNVGKSTISMGHFQQQTVSQNQMVISIYGEIGDGLWLYGIGLPTVK